MFGGAFSIKHYAPYIALLEAAVGEAVRSRRETLSPKLSEKALRERISVKKSAYARVLVVGGDICFLYFPNETTPVMRGSRVDLAEGEDREIACYADGDEIICFDGWLRTVVERDDRVLVALQEDETERPAGG